MQIQCWVAVLASWVSTCLDVAQNVQQVHCMQAPARPPLQALIWELSSVDNELRVSLSEAKTGMTGEGKTKHWLQTPFSSLLADRS